MAHVGKLEHMMSDITITHHGLMQKRRNSSALGMELHPFCIKLEHMMSDMTITHRWLNAKET